MQIFNKNRGNITLEASIVFPLVIIVFISIFLVFIFIFNNLISQSNRHIVMRKKAGEVSKTLVSYLENNIDDDFNIRKEKKGLGEVLVSEYNNKLRSNYKKFMDIEIGVKDFLYILDEKRVIKFYEIVKDEKNQ